MPASVPALDIARFGDLLRCPRCLQSKSLATAANESCKCRACAAAFSTAGGILDFVSGQDDTALDVGVYDRQKGVGLDLSRQVFGHLKERSAGAIADDLGVVLEVGAGTGLLSMAMLKDSKFERAVISDVSVNMLACARERILLHLGTASDNILFVTYDCQQPILADAAFDLCIANSVLHHVRDYRGFLADVAKALKPGGNAVYAEPTAPYHDALSRAMADALAEMIARKQIGACEPDAALAALMICDIRYRLAFRGDPSVLALEDKHLFTREQLLDDSRQAGFAEVMIEPTNIDRDGHSGVREYGRELGLSAPFLDCFLPIYDRYAQRYFQSIKTEDQSGMYLCAFRA